IPQLDTPILFATGLSAGLGSNDIGLDRGQSGGGRIVEFERTGPKVLMVQQNTSFRSSSTDPIERRDVEDAFAKSVLWGFPIIAETDGRVLVDATDYFLHDVQGAAGRLGAGYHVDRSRSGIYLPWTKNFPQNTEVDVTLTFVKQGPQRGAGAAVGPVQGPAPIGREPAPEGAYGRSLFSGTVASVTPDPEAVTLREHYSLVQLPDSHYTPRLYNPSSGYSDVMYQDYSAPLGSSMSVRYIRRHRLEKVDPSAKVSDAVKPIVYYIDPGTPEPMRSALMTGVSWWNQAFEYAGYRNAFQVKLLPADADPMDIRYNIINWVHRSTRGWSSGGGVTDPRTGEIIKGVVTLGSLRVRQDYLIFEGLLSPYSTGRENPAILSEASLARLRQLAAHESGHTLGFAHNYSDSTRGYISVMDYPHPMETLNADGTIDVSHPYGVGIGDWDKVAIDWGYQDFPTGTDVKAALQKILDDAAAKDLQFLTNQDMDVNPKADQWVNGSNVTTELNRIMKVRRAALNRIGEKTIRADQPLATIEEALVPIFMYHRYAVEATASTLGGQHYFYALRGDRHTPPMTRATAAEQHAALDALMATLKPSELTVPKSLLAILPPRPPSWGFTRELFPRTTGNSFDPLTPASVASDMTIGFVLDLNRVSRIVDQHAVDPTLPGLDEVITRLEQATFNATTANAYEAAVKGVEESVLVNRLSWVASGSDNPEARAIASFRLSKLATRLKAATGGSEIDQAQNQMLAADITRFLNRPYAPIHPIYAPMAPPGAPIGDTGMNWLAPAPICGWSPNHPDSWTWTWGPTF
ncbi:MAG: zinc-dependent metalloprotease, partial [Acidobacteriota bacterium]|nr:zinc-dependent metalloprotease [Acidobacteriota bacterium]